MSKSHYPPSSPTAETISSELKPKTKPPEMIAADAARYRVALAEQELANAKAALYGSFKTALVDLFNRYQFKLIAPGKMTIVAIEDPQVYTLKDLNQELSE